MVISATKNFRLMVKVIMVVVNTKRIGGDSIGKEKEERPQDHDNSHA